MLSIEFALLVALLVLILVGLELISNLDNIEIKKVAVLVFSIGIIAWIDFKSMLLLLVYSSIIIFLIRKRVELIKRRLVLFVFVNIVLLIIIKDYYLFVELDNIYIPMGVSYYFFRLISFFIEETKRLKSENEISLLDYYTYVFFFPVFLAGPIQRYNDFFVIDKIEQVRSKRKNYCILCFAVLAKLFIVDIVIFPLAYVNLYSKLLEGISKSDVRYLILYSFGFVAFLHAYLDLMIYTEISKSVSTILGFSKQENFNKPLLATNISMFWQKWHISLSNWTRDYIFFPTLVKTKKVWLSTYASMMMIGIWHSISFAWFFWAFAHASALNLYFYLRGTGLFRIIASKKMGRQFLKITGNIVTISFVSLIFVVVALKDGDVIIKLLKIILGFHF